MLLKIVSRIEGALPMSKDQQLELFDASKSVLACLHALVTAFPISHAVYHAANLKHTAVDEPYVRTTYSDRWITHYLLKGYVSIDPIVKRGFESTLPFYWHEIDFTSPSLSDFLLEAQAHNVGTSGLSIPIIDKQGRKALFSVTSDEDPDTFYRVIHPELEILQACANVLHQRVIEFDIGEAAQRPVLSPRETECMKWISRGKDAQAIAIILDISEHTVRDYLKSARNKLGAVTLPQAIHKATIYNLIKSN